MFRGPGSRPVGERRHRGKEQPPLTGRARSRPARPGRDPATTRSAPMPGRADLADTLRPLSGPRCVSLLTADSRTRTRGPGLADPDSRTPSPGGPAPQQAFRHAGSVGPWWQAACMRPAIKSGLLPVWRDRDTLQIGIDPRRAVALSGMGQAAPLIGLLDGSRDRDQVIAAAAGRGIPVEATERVLTLLAAGGALDDFPAGTLRALPSPLRAKLAPELATTSLARRDADGGARALARRRAAVVTIEGDRRIGRAIARILSASGIGRVRFARMLADDQDGTAASGTPATASSSSGARPELGPGTGNRTERAPGTGNRPDPRQPTGPGTRPGPGQPTRPGTRARGRSRSRPPCRPDLVILVGDRPADHASDLTRERIAHLAVMASEAIGIVGPLVVPGRTACLRCLDYVRAGNDPAWPLILAQIRRRRPEPAACDAVLAAAVAAQAAAQALTAIETAPIASAAASGTLELVLPDWRWRRRTWPPHPACPCTSTPSGNRQ